MSAVILALMILAAFEVLWARVAALRPHRWHFRAMLAIFWSVMLAVYLADRLNVMPGLFTQGIPRFASDAATYQHQARALVEGLRSGDSVVFFDHQAFSYSRLLAVLYFAFGDRALVGNVFNGVFYMASAIAIFSIGRQLFGDRAGLVAAWLFACSPTLLLHETQTLRWASTTAGLHVAVLGTILLTGTGWILGFFLSLLGFAVLLNDLPYISRLFVVVVALYSIVPFLCRRLGPERVRIAVRIGALAVTLGALYYWTWGPVVPQQDITAQASVGRSGGVEPGDQGDRSAVSGRIASTVDRLINPALSARAGFIREMNALQTAGISVGTEIDGPELSGFGDFVRNLPAAARIALTEPTIPRLLANSNGSSRVGRLAIPEMLCLYGITVMAIWGGILGVRSGPRARLQIVFVVLLVAGAYILLGSTILNAGTLHRLRHPYVGLLCVFAAIGMSPLLERVERGQVTTDLASAKMVH